jgi:hypothetical protein
MICPLQKECVLPKNILHRDNLIPRFSAHERISGPTAPCSAGKETARVLVQETFLLGKVDISVFKESVSYLNRLFTGNVIQNHQRHRILYSQFSEHQDRHRPDEPDNYLPAQIARWMLPREAVDWCAW